MDVKVKIPSWGREVLVQVPDSKDVKKAFNDASRYVSGLFDRNEIRDLEGGIKPPGATHEIVKQPDGQYRLQRFRQA